MPLTAKKVAALTKPGRHHDGDGLSLKITATGSRSWVLRIQVNGRRVERGLGPVGTMTLAEARDKAADLRRAAFASNTLPATLAEARAAIEDAPPPPPRPTFKEVAAELITGREAGWRNGKHAAQWTSSLAAYAYPHIGDMAVEDIRTDDILKVLRPIWSTKPETASRVRQRMEAVLGAAGVRGLTGDKKNPAAWRGHLALILPAPRKVRQVEHHAALPHADLPAFFAELKTRDGVSARALELLILTACRSGEVRGMVWGEVDLKAATWTIPAGRMKGGREHVVPLPPAAVEVLSRVRGAERREPSELVFLGQRKAALSDMSIAAVVKRMKRDGQTTVHGFRSTFRDWAAENGVAHELAEVALAHTVGTAVVKAYLRSSLLQQRRELMVRWANFVCSNPVGPTNLSAS